MSLEKIINLIPKKYWFLFGVVFLMVVVSSFLSAYLPWYLMLGGLIMLIASFFIWKDSFLGILLIAFWLPFERLGAYEFGEMTIRLSQIFLIVTLFWWIFNLISKGSFKFAKNPALIPLTLFLLVGVFSLPTTLNLERSLTVYLFILFTSILAFIIPNLVINTKQLKKIVTIIIFSFILVSSFGIFQFTGDMIGLPTEVTGLRELYTKDILGFTRVQSTAYEPLYFANYLLLPIALIFALLLSGRGLFKVSWWVVLLGLGLINLVLTVSRGGYLAIFMTLAFIALFYLKKILTIKNLVIFVLIIVFIGWTVTQALGIGGGFFTIDKFGEHITNAFYGASFDERVDTFSTAIDAWHDHPWLGVGFGGFGTYAAVHPYYMPKDGWRIVNNQFIEILAENGIVGLLLYLSLLLILIVRSVRAIKISKNNYIRAVMIALLAVLIGIIVQYQTFSTLYIMHIWFVIGLMIAVQNMIIFNREEIDSK